MTLAIASYTIYHSPNSYLGMVAAERELADLPVSLERRPIHVPRARGLRVADLVGGAESPRASSYHREDCPRWAARLGVPLRFPPPTWFAERAALWAGSPYEREELPARAYYAARGTGREAALDRALFEAAWVRGEDVNSPETILDCAGRCGLDGEALLERLAGDEPGRCVREALAAFDQAVCPGVPTFLFEGQRFWGKDRVALLADAVRAAVAEGRV